MAYDGLHDIFTDQAMGNLLTESKNQAAGSTDQPRGAGCVRGGVASECGAGVEGRAV